MRIKVRTFIALAVAALLACLPMTAQAAPPVCWSKDVPDGTGTPAQWDTSITGYVLGWMCKIEGEWKPVAVFGHWTELPGNWMEQVRALRNGSDEARAAAWDAGMTPDRDYSDILPMVQALIANLQPPNLRTYDTRAYDLVKQRGKFVPLVVGRVPLDLQCDESQDVNGLYAVPTSEVTWTGNVQPPVVVAKCRQVQTSALER